MKPKLKPKLKPGLQPEEVTAIVLCGGSGRRLGGVEKPLVRVGGRALVEFVIERLRAQADRVVLSLGGGQDADAYAAFGCELVIDAEPGQGPLGGLVSCFAQLPGTWFLICPADMPSIAPNLVAALSKDARARGVAVAHDGQRRQNLNLLIGRGEAESLTRFYARGGRAVHRWLDARAVPATDLSRIAASFANLNEPADLARFRKAARTVP